jgi:DNA replication and repair protein RecF
MLLRKVDIVNFKNIEEASVEFSPTVNCLLGKNGMGKSNLLEAIHFLSFVRGFRTLPDSAYIRHGQQSMLVKGSYIGEDGTADIVSCGLVAGKRKSLKCNDKEYQRMSEHIGRFPLVVVAPQDSTLVTGSGEERRRFMDMVISQADKSYLEYLARYNRALESRNRMLRSGIRDSLLYESVEAPLCEAATQIHATRAKWVEEMQPIFSGYYAEVAANGEAVSLSYKSALNDMTMAELLKRNAQKDAILGYTSGGTHRDDLESALGDYSLRKLGSQGQIKTFTIALKFAVYDFLKRKKGVTPLLLLDDIFDKLDSTRVEHIMQVVAPQERFGQIFITDTNREHLDRIIATLSGNLLLEVEAGHFTPIQI